jgi:uncharacterized membrane protein
MWSVYVTIAFVAGWMALATWGPLHRGDAFPFPFLLFLGNLVQLCLVFIILVGQQVLGRATDERAAKTYDDAEEILREVLQLHDHLGAQDAILNRGMRLVESSPHPWIKQRQAVKPARVEDHHVGLNGRIARFLTRMVGTMWAFYIAAIGQILWIGFAQLGILSFDPYPFAFLLFVSSLLQLIFMFVIMVGVDVLGQAATREHTRRSWTQKPSYMNASGSKSTSSSRTKSSSNSVNTSRLTRQKMATCVKLIVRS